MSRYRVRRKSRDWTTYVAVLIFLALFGFGIWVAFFAPCDWIDWVKASEVPARCLR